MDKSSGFVITKIADSLPKQTPETHVQSLDFIQSFVGFMLILNPT
jgi:hypothetical protein